MNLVYRLLKTRNVCSFDLIITKTYEIKRGVVLVRLPVCMERYCRLQGWQTSSLSCLTSGLLTGFLKFSQMTAVSLSATSMSRSIFGPSLRMASALRLNMASEKRHQSESEIAHHSNQQATTATTWRKKNKQTNKGHSACYFT